MNINILTDNEKSWFVPYGNQLKLKLVEAGHNVTYVFDKTELGRGDICFLLSCSRIVDKFYLSLHSVNIVVHASDLPKGKGFSPIQWQIFEGKDKITLSLLKAVEKVDSGPIYFKHEIFFEGHELYDEIREIVGNEIINMCLKFVDNYPTLKPVEQVGQETFYRKRTKKDDEIDPMKSISELFNHFRIADNHNHPLYFYFKNHKYFLKIEKEKNNNYKV